MAHRFCFVETAGPQMLVKALCAKSSCFILLKVEVEMAFRLLKLRIRMPVSWGISFMGTLVKPS